MVTQSLSFETGDLSPVFLSGAARLVFKEQPFADDSPIETFDECQNPKRPYLWANDFHSKRVLIVRPGCKLWSCPACAQRNRRRWSVRIYQGIRDYEQERREWWLATITLLGGRFHRDFLRDVAIWRDGWSRLYLRMKRHTSIAGNPHLRYVLIPELAPDTERLHVHMLLNDSLTAVPTKRGKRKWRSDFLKDAAAEVGLGYMNDIEPIKEPQYAAAYASKYVGKSLGVKDWPPNFRRIRTSVGWPELRREESIGQNLNWNISDARKIHEIIERFWTVGFDAINLNTGEVIEMINLEEL